MTREELSSLGGNDTELVQAYRKLTGITINLDRDDDETGRTRRVAFDRVASEAMMVVAPLRGRPISSFAVDNPAVHRASAKT